jgi:hypothetical protein
MEPVFYANDQIIVHGSNHYKQNDIVIVADERNKLICHRINFCNETFILTSGDNNVYFDIPVKYTNIIGKITNGNSGSDFIDHEINNNISFFDCKQLNHSFLDELNVIPYIIICKKECFQKFLNNHKLKGKVEKPLKKSERCLIIYNLPEIYEELLPEKAHSIYFL